MPSLACAFGIDNFRNSESIGKFLTSSSKHDFLKSRSEIKLRAITELTIDLEISETQKRNTNVSETKNRNTIFQKRNPQSMNEFRDQRFENQLVPKLRIDLEIYDTQNETRSSKNHFSKIGIVNQTPRDSKKTRIDLKISETQKRNTTFKKINPQSTKTKFEIGGLTTWHDVRICNFPRLCKPVIEIYWRLLLGQITFLRFLRRACLVVAPSSRPHHVLVAPPGPRYVFTFSTLRLPGGFSSLRWAHDLPLLGPVRFYVFTFSTLHLPGGSSSLRWAQYVFTFSTLPRPGGSSFRSSSLSRARYVFTFLRFYVAT